MICEPLRKLLEVQYSSSKLQFLSSNSAIYIHIKQYHSTFRIQINIYHKRIQKANRDQCNTNKPSFFFLSHLSC